MHYDFAIIGSGISGSAAASELATLGSAVLLEAESTPGFHSTGRSAAMYTPNYGPELVRRISRLSYPFLSNPPADFTEQPLLSPRGMIHVAPDGGEQDLERLMAEGEPDRKVLTIEQTMQLAPFLRADRLAGAVYEGGVADMDVDALHQGFLRRFKHRGGTLLTDARVTQLSRSPTGWEVVAGGEELTAGIIINAAGAWAQSIGELAGCEPIGLQPKRRTAILVDAPEGLDLNDAPLIDFTQVDNYIKPEVGQLMVSPGDATPVAAQDVQPEDMDVAVLVDWLERETQLEVRRVNHQWAGLRSFVADDCPVVGFDPSVEHFFWLAGQGGFGIMMSESLGRASAHLIRTGQLPEDFQQAGITAAMLSGDRLKASPA